MTDTVTSGITTEQAVAEAKNFVVDRALRWAREEDVCDSVLDALSYVFETPNHGNHWVDSDGVDCYGTQRVNFRDNGHGPADADLIQRVNELSQLAARHLGQSFAPLSASSGETQVADRVAALEKIAQERLGVRTR
jgi:hypothetical protein